MRASLLASLAMMLLASAGSAQQATARRFMAGLYLHTVAVSAPAARALERSTNLGAGVGARLGWGITPRITLFASLSGARLAYDKADSNTHSAVIFGALGASHHFTKIGRSWVPYVEISRSALTLEDRWTDDTGVTRFGSGDENAWSVGAGVDHRFTETWHVNAGLDATRADGGRHKATILSRLNVGLTYRPYEEPDRQQ